VKIKIWVLHSSECCLVSPLTILPQQMEAPARFQPTGPLCHQPAAGLHRSREGHRTEWGGAPPDGIPGSPSPWCPNSLSSLDPAWTPRSGPTHLAVLSGLGKHHPQEISPKSGPIPLDGRGPWSTPGNLREEFHRSSVRSSPTGRKGSLIHSRELPRGVPQVRDFSQRGEENCYNFGVNVCVCVNLFKAWAKFKLLLEFQFILCMLKLTFFLACLIYKAFLCVYVNILKLVLKLLL
jgi:hypothetical protein